MGTQLWLRLLTNLSFIRSVFFPANKDPLIISLSEESSHAFTLLYDWWDDCMLSPSGDMAVNAVTTTGSKDNQLCGKCKNSEHLAG